MRFVRRRKSQFLIHRVMGDDEEEFSNLVGEMKDIISSFSSKFESVLTRIQDEMALLKKDVYRVFPAFPSFINEINRVIERYGSIDITDLRQYIIKGLESASTDEGMYDFIMYIYENYRKRHPYTKRVKIGEPEQLEILRNMSLTVKELTKDAITNCDRYYYDAEKVRLKPLEFEKAEKEYLECLSHIFKQYLPRIKEYTDNINIKKLEKELKTLFKIIFKTQ